MQLHFCSAWRLTLKHNQYHKPCLLFLYFSGSLPFLSSRDIDRMMRHGSEIGQWQSAALICTSIPVGPKANTAKLPTPTGPACPIFCGSRNIGNTLLRPKKSKTVEGIAARVPVRAVQRWHPEKQAMKQLLVRSQETWNTRPVEYETRRFF